MAEGPFLVRWEACLSSEYDKPDAAWIPHERAFAQEIDAVRHWGAMKRYVNTRPVSIEPSPDWARYSYDGRTPLTK